MNRTFIYGFYLNLSLGLLESSCFALQTYPLIDHQSTTVTISQTEQNRIAVLGDRIQQVFGTEGTFEVQSDEEGGQIFLMMPKSGVSYADTSSAIKSRTITLMTEEGLTQDLKLILKDIEAQSILLKPMLSFPDEHPREGYARVGPKDTHLQQVITLLKAMVKNEELQGYTKIFPEPKSPLGGPLKDIVPKNFHLKSVKVEPIVTYRSSTYKGHILSLTNQGKTMVFLNESDFVLPKESALSLSKRLLSAGETITLYAVTREGEPKSILENARKNTLENALESGSRRRL